jgi:hypothetical protein
MINKEAEHRISKFDDLVSLEEANNLRSVRSMVPDSPPSATRVEESKQIDAFIKKRQSKPPTIGPNKVQVDDQQLFETSQIMEEAPPSKKQSKL